MRKNYTHTPEMPNNRNEFIDCLKKQSEVIVIKHDLVNDLSKELNKSIGNQKGKTILQTAGIATLLICNLYNPLTWIFGIGSLTTSGLLKNNIKRYNVYLGRNVTHHEIIVLIHKSKVDLTLDTISYNKNYVLSVENKPYKKTIK